MEAQDVAHFYDWYNVGGCSLPQGTEEGECNRHARPSQTPPPGSWLTWLARAGRGWGKTRTGSGFVHQRALAHAGRWMALVSKTPADARDYMVEGPGGLLKNTHPNERPLWEPSKRRLTWPNGSWATIYSSEDPDALRGFSGDTFWLDEFAKWPKPKLCWDNLMFGMRERSDDRPRGYIGTTPRPIPVLKQIIKDRSTIEVTGSSYENRANLAPEWFSEVLSQYEGTAFGRQEIDAEMLEEIEGALWTLKRIEELRLDADQCPDDMERIVVSVDPSGTKGGDEQGIITVGRARCPCNGQGEVHGFVLDDLSGHYSPQGWGQKAVDSYDTWRADRIVAEVNYAGDMVEATIKTVDGSVAYKAVHATRGKRVRAEPIAAMTEQGKIHHVGPFPDLEDQLTTWLPANPGSPDRLDAYVWGFTELFPKSTDRWHAW